MAKKKAKLTIKQRRELMPELVDSLAAKRKAMIAAGLNDGRYQTRRGGPDKRNKIRNSECRREMHG